jgi:hypothetical protein
MPEADAEATTIAKNPNVELTPVSCEYVAADEVLFSMKTIGGAVVTFTLKTAAMVHLVNLSVNLINTCTSQVFKSNLNNQH